MDSSNTVSTMHVLNAVNKGASDAAAAQCADTSAILQEQAGTNLANMANTERLGLFIDDNVYRSQLATREAIERNADQIVDIVNSNNQHLSAAVDRTGEAAVHTTLRAENEITNLVQHTTSEVKQNQQDIATETRASMNEHHSKTIELSKDSVINDNRNATDVELQASSNTFSVKKDVKHVDGHLELQAAQNTAQIQYEAVKLQGEMSAEVAECCCELKEEVSKSNYETQKLARDIESKRLRDELAAATTESLINKLKYWNYGCYSKKPPMCPCSPPPCPPGPPSGPK